MSNSWGHLYERRIFMRKRTTKLAALLCVAVLSLAGCGSKQSDVAETEVAATETTVEEAETTTEMTTEATTETTTSEVSLSYEFTGQDAAKAGYAEGTVSLSSSEAGTYQLFWSDDSGALKGYYPIADLEVAAGKTAEFAFEYHTVIPVEATKVIAVNAQAAKEYPTVSEAAAVFDIPAEKKLGVTSEDALYTFNSYSDIHIDEEHFGETPAYWWEYSEAHWASALEYATELGTDFIVATGDQVTNANLDNLDKEWQAYQLILAQSDYVNPVYESGGNHEVRQDGAVEEELQAFITGSGLDSSLDTLALGKSYYAITEPKTGDLFIFMSLEGGYRPAQYDEFTEEQLDWVEALLEENYGKGKNIYLIQHALISGYGPGDDLETPYYGGSMNPELPTAQRFISLLEKYPEMVWISGHSHEDFALGYNYTDNNGTACSMIHNPSVSNPTHVTDGAIDYTFYENMSQGYYVQTFESAIIFNGANLCDKKIYPAYSYIIDGSTSLNEQVEEETILYKDVEVTDATLRSVLANVNTVLGIHYEFSSYDQYQTLKKYYYQYKDADTTAMSEDEVLTAYSQLRLAIAYLHQVTEFTRGVEYEVVIPEPVVEEEVVARETELLLRVHYHREDGDYTPWTVWLWGTGDGTDNAFTGEDEYGVYLEYVVEPGTAEVGFIVRTESWEKDVDADQFISVGSVEGDTLDVYIESGVEGYEVK